MSGAFRPARSNPSDYEAYARLFLELAVPDPIPSRERYDEEIAPQSFVAERDGAIVGWMLTVTLENVGYVRQLMVDSGHRRGGLGRALMLEAARRFDEQGCDDWCLNVKPDNVAALGLYRALGMEQRYTSVAVRLSLGARHGLSASEDCHVAPLTDEERGPVEAALHIPPGLLGRLTGGGRLHLVCHEAGQPVGLAAFDPAFPGCFPFRTNAPRHARALLDALAAEVGDITLQVVLEDQPAVVAALEAAGATRVLDFVHLRGPVPGPRLRATLARPSHPSGA